MPLASIPESYFNRSRVLVLGNSGSLLEQPRQEDWADDLLVIGVNRILREGLDGRRYNPHIIVISDGRAFETEKEALKDYEGVLMLVRWIPTDIPHVIFDSWPSKRLHYREDIKSFPWSLTDRMRHWNNVAAQASQIAMLLCDCGGTVYLAGCENTWPKPGDPRRAKHHFYSDRPIEDDLRPFQVNVHLARQWAVLARWMKDHGGKRLVTTTPWRDLALPGLEFDSIPLKETR